MLSYKDRPKQTTPILPPTRVALFEAISPGHYQYMPSVSDSVLLVCLVSIDMAAGVPFSLRTYPPSW